MPWFLQSLLGFTKSQGPQSFRLGNQRRAQNPDFFGGRVSDITRVAADGIILADGVPSSRSACTAVFAASAKRSAW
jgi:hypothetical protein